MKFKMRVVHFSPNGQAEKIGDVIAKEQNTEEDKIPPAYPVENEKLLFIGTELKGNKVNAVVTDLCKNLTPARAKNVAFYAIGSGDFSAIDELKSIVAATGCTVIDDVFTCTVKSGLFKKGNVTEEDIKNATAWADKVVHSLAN